MPNELHTMPLNCEKLISSRRYRRMRLDEKGAYLHLLIEAWLDGARLENDPDGIRELLGISEDVQWERIRKFVVEKMFVPSEDGKWLVNPTQDEIYKKVIFEVQSNSDRGRKGAEARWSVPKQCSSNAQAMQPHGLSNGTQNQNQNQRQTQSINTHSQESMGILRTFNPLEKEPMPEEVKADAELKGIICTIERCREFIDHYASTGWRLPSGAFITDWRRRVRGFMDKPAQTFNGEKPRKKVNTDGLY